MEGFRGRGWRKGRREAHAEKRVANEGRMEKMEHVRQRKIKMEGCE